MKSRKKWSSVRWSLQLPPPNRAPQAAAVELQNTRPRIYSSIQGETL
jgi:hypothetical protein